MSLKENDDEYTRQTRSMRDCYNIQLSCDETTVLFFNSITDKARHNTKYCNFFVASILVIKQLTG